MQGVNAVQYLNCDSEKERASELNWQIAAISVVLLGAINKLTIHFAFHIILHYSHERIILPPFLALNFSHFLMSLALNLLYREREKCSWENENRVEVFFYNIISHATQCISASIGNPGNV